MNIEYAEFYTSVRGVVFLQYLKTYRHGSLVDLHDHLHKLLFNNVTYVLFNHLGIYAFHLFCHVYILKHCSLVELP